MKETTTAHLFGVAFVAGVFVGALLVCLCLWMSAAPESVPVEMVEVERLEEIEVIEPERVGR